MPDLDIVVMRVCQSNEHWKAEVDGSKGDTYTVTFGPIYGRQAEVLGCTHGWSCTCKQFSHRLRGVGECKHIKAVKRLRCGWHQQFGGQYMVGLDPVPDGVRVLTPPSHDPEEDALEPCPCCGGATFAQRCAV